MTEDRPTRVVYLFGAGATQAELQSFDADLAEKSGLLVSQLSAGYRKGQKEQVVPKGRCHGFRNIRIVEY
jgi:hypothetical protein